MFKLSNMLSSATYGHFHFWKDVQSRTVTLNDLKLCTLIRVDLLYYYLLEPLSPPFLISTMLKTVKY